MPLKVCFVHSVSTVISQFNKLAREYFPTDVAFFHIADETIQKVVLRKGELTPFLYQRVAEDVLAAEYAGADIIQLTCSSISPCVNVVKEMVSVPVLKIDEPMVDNALSYGKCVGVASTANCTLKPTTDLIYERAKVTKTRVDIDSRLCEGAYDALFYKGDPKTHDQIVRQTLYDLMAKNDVVVLAQASMSQVAETIPAEDIRVPILSSPRLAMEYLRDLINSMMG